MPRQELALILRHGIKEGESSFYQHAYGAEDKRALQWIPGGAMGLPLPSRNFDGRESKFFGLAPGIYPDEWRDKHQHEVPEITLGWAGIDIDLGAGRDAETVAAALKNVIPFSSLRLSAGGGGIHVITRITPIKVPTQQRSRYIKAINKPIVDLILKSGLVKKEEVCKSDYRIFWLFGGKNKWLHASPEVVTCKTETIAQLITSAGDWSRSVTVSENKEETSPRLKQVLDLLSKQGLRLNPGRNQLNICYAHRALKETEWKFESRSGDPTPDDPPSRTNGFIEYIPSRRITIFANADGRVVREFCTAEEMRSRIGG